MPDRTWYTLRAKSDARRAELYLYDEIGNFGIRVNDFVREINRHDVDELDLFINSPGGDAYDAYAVFNALSRHPATVHVVVDGLAASAATIVAMAAAPGELRMVEPSAMMIHDPWTVTIGDVAAHTSSIQQLEAATEQVVGLYHDRSGREPDEIRALMAAETWFTPAQAVDMGFADGVIEAAPNMLTTGRVFNLAKFRNVPDWVANAPETPRAGIPEPIRIAASIRGRRVAAYLEHHDPRGVVDLARARLALDRALNTAIPVADREATIQHLRTHLGG